MDSVSLSPANQAYVQQNKQQVATNPQNSNAPEQKKNGKKLLIAGATAVATITVAGIMLYKGKKAKAQSLAQQGTSAMHDAAREIQQNASKKFKDIKFNKGIAKDKDGNLFTGIIDDVVGSKKKGLKKVKLEYKDGVIQKSTIEPKNGIKLIKKYETKLEELNNENMVTNWVWTEYPDYDGAFKCFYAFKDKNGNVVKTVRNTGECRTSFDFKNKKVVAKFVYSGKDRHIYVYDNNGNIARKLGKSDYGKNYFEEIEHLANGEKKVITTWVDPNAVSNHITKSIEIGEPNKITWLDKEGVPLKRLIFEDASKEIDKKCKNKTYQLSKIGEGTISIFTDEDDVPCFNYHLKDKMHTVYFDERDTLEDKQLLKEKIPVLFETLKQEGITIPERVLEYFEKI